MNRKLTALAATTALVLGLAACSSDDAASTSPTSGGPGPVKVRVGVVGSQDDQWPVLVEKAKAEGIEVELVNFTSYPEPNPALTQGQLDLNQFQHIQYLADYNIAADEDLVALGSTAIYPLALYSDKHTSIDAIPAGGEIAVPNDPTNLNRALFILQSAGLVELRDGGTLASTELDVLPDSKVKVTPVDAAQTAISLKSVDGAIINNDFIADTDLKPSDAIAQDDPASVGARPYINVWAARAEDKDNATYLKLIELAQSDEVEAALKTASGDTAVIVREDAGTLASYLSDVEEQVRSGK